MMPILITARLQSTRLPRKHLAPLLPGRSAIGCLIQRLLHAGLPLILCVPNDEINGALAEVGRGHGIGVFVGDDSNVLRRYEQAMMSLDIDSAITVDGDDPFVSIGMIQRIADCYAGEDVVLCSGLPWGGAPYALSREFVARMLEQGVSPHFWGPRLHTQECRKLILKTDEFTAAEQRYRLTIDYPIDLAFTREIYRQLGMDGVIDLVSVARHITSNLSAYQMGYSAIFDGTLDALGQEHLAREQGEVRLT